MKRIKPKSKAEKRLHWRPEAKKTTRAPATLRYCLICRKNNWFRYDYGTGHSNCMNCGQFRSAKPE